MADATENTESTTQGAPAAKAGKLPLIGSIVAGVVLGAVVGMFVLGPRFAPASPRPAASADAVADEGGHGEEGGDAKHGGKTPVRPMYTIENLVLNPAGSGGTRFLLLSVALQAKDEAAIEQLKGRDAELRDAILRTFGSKTVDQVSEASARDGLRGEMLATVDRIVPKGTVTQVFFPQFVIQ